MHFVGRSSERRLPQDVTYEGHSRQYSRQYLIDHTTGSVHTGLSLNQMEPGGMVAAHVHSFEESFYLLEGELSVAVDGQMWELQPGDFGLFKVGIGHAWQATGNGPVRWLEMAAPQPKPAGSERDTFFRRAASAIGRGKRFAGPAAFEAAEGCRLGHFGVENVPPPGPARASLAGAQGVFLKWLIDESLGAIHQRMIFIEYQPGASIGLHDHTYEESYFILSGKVEAVLDGKRYVAGPGDVLWTGVGCVHSFASIGQTPVRWVETFSPQPPRENVFRFMGEWEQRAREIES